jgi:hypothetical protein
MKKGLNFSNIPVHPYIVGGKLSVADRQPGRRDSGRGVVPGFGHAVPQLWHGRQVLHSPGPGATGDRNFLTHYRRSEACEGIHFRLRSCAIQQAPLPWLSTENSPTNFPLVKRARRVQAAAEANANVSANRSPHSAT